MVNLKHTGRHGTLLLGFHGIGVSFDLPVSKSRILKGNIPGISVTVKYVVLHRYLLI